MQFLYPALTIGFALAAVPLLIHLINMMRHRRVRWAAMEFLLQSYKKHRKWVWLKQLILLLMRMAAMVLIVAMLAQLVTQRRYEGLFGTTLTHHYVLLDDSYSMTDRAGGTTAMDRALKFVRQLGAEAAAQELRQRFTLIRFSKAAAAGNQSDNPLVTAQVADLNAEDVDSKFAIRIEEIRRGLEPTELPVGPQAALRVAHRMMGENDDEHRIVYVLSDFRARQWDNPSEIRQRFGELEKSGAVIRLIDCVRTQRTNLALTELKATSETRAAGVPLFVNISVTNFGNQAQDNVQLKVRTFFYDHAAIADGKQAQPISNMDELPIVPIERIEPHQTITKRVQVYFPEAGRHIVQAVLPEDPVSTDNYRWCVVDLPEGESVLVVDGDPDQRNAFYLNTIFQPSTRVRTGIRPNLVDKAFLRDTTPALLRSYSAIYLFDVDRLDDRAVSNLEAYVRAGGGLAFFVGPQVNIKYYNQQLFRGGQGLFPVPLGRDGLLESITIDGAPDVHVLEPNHPVFRELVAGQNPLIRMIHVQRFLQTKSDWSPAGDSGVDILAQLRDSSPLAVEKRVGEGRVIAIMTTFAPYWNDMTLGPCVLIALRLQAYLGTAQRIDHQHEVGQPITLKLDSSKYQPNIRIFAPGDDPAAPLTIERQAEKPSTDSPIYTATIRGDETQRSGVYEVWLRNLDSSIDAVRFAVNVDPREGDLRRTDMRRLLTKLDPLPVQMQYADQYESGTIKQAGFNQSVLIMVLLILLLLAEQVVAYVASFHPSRRASRGANR